MLVAWRVDLGRARVMLVAWRVDLNGFRAVLVAWRASGLLAALLAAGLAASGVGAFGLVGWLLFLVGDSLPSLPRRFPIFFQKVFRRVLVVAGRVPGGLFRFGVFVIFVFSPFRGLKRFSAGLCLGFRVWVSGSSFGYFEVLTFSF